MQSELSADQQQDRKQQALRELAHKLAPKPSDRGPPQQPVNIEETWTLQEKLLFRLRFAAGIPEDEAAQIVDRVKSLPILEPLKDRWHEYAENLSPAFHGALWRQTTAAALKWFDENPTRDHTALLRRKGFRSDVTP